MAPATFPRTARHSSSGQTENRGPSLAATRADQSRAGWQRECHSEIACGSSALRSPQGRGAREATKSGRSDSRCVPKGEQERAPAAVLRYEQGAEVGKDSPQQQRARAGRRGPLPSTLPSLRGEASGAERGTAPDASFVHLCGKIAWPVVPAVVFPRARRALASSGLRV